MNPLKKITAFAMHTFLNSVDERTLAVYAAAKKQAPPSEQLERTSETLQAQTLDKWKMAVMSATDPLEPEKTMLEDLYQNLMLDNHLASVIDSRILYAQRSPFKIVNEKGDENEELTWLFERTWFEEFIRETLMSRFEGVKLIELYDLNPMTKELASIEVIPMTFFSPKKGIITKSVGDQTGWLYKEGAMLPYYIQVGKNSDIGLLARIAPIVLAKKLGLGSWLDYIEKYGVPPLFITTDREDDQRRKELFEAGMNFKSNHFMVGRGNEKFEIGKAEAGNPDNFDKLIERANSEISKRILGGSGLTDEKAFVGSAEIQFRLTKDRYESDKLLVKNIINQDLFPRLQKISTVYSGLANHYFVWDDTEVQTSNEIVEKVSKLAPYFELDQEEISQKVGLKILGQKSNNANPEAVEEVKKKSLNEK